MANNSLKDSLNLVEGYQSWSATELGNYLKTQGLEDYHEVVVQHKITGQLAPLVKDPDLKDMGINIVGDRLRFRKVIQSFSRKARFLDRGKVIWEGEEKLFWGFADRMCGTCCGCCPEDPSQYKLTRNHLKVKQVEQQRCGPVSCCCCNTYKLNNIDLTHVKDVNVMGGLPPPCCLHMCCCASGKDMIHISYDDQQVVMTLGWKEGELVSTQILNQVEECQVMERAG